MPPCTVYRERRYFGSCRRLFPRIISIGRGTSETAGPFMFFHILLYTFLYSSSTGKVESCLVVLENARYEIRI